MIEIAVLVLASAVLVLVLSVVIMAVTVVRQLTRIELSINSIRIRLLAHLDWLENGGNAPGEVIPFPKPPGNSDD